jgi:hypothetical protein
MNLLARRTLRLLCLPSLFALATVCPAADPPPAADPFAPPVPARQAEHHAERRVWAADWNGPTKIVSEILYDNLPITEVGEDLRKRFSDAFDVLYPIGSESDGGWDWRNALVGLRLKNVTAMEIFNAMNLVFETAKTPLRWELIQNGNRPTALLRSLYDRPAGVDPTTGLPVGAPPPPIRPMVYFVGDLLGDPKDGGMTFEQVIKTVSEVCNIPAIGDRLSVHPQAQLLVVRGTPDEIAFVRQTLSALEAKAHMDARKRNREAAPESKPEPKSGTDPHPSR